MGRRAVMPWQTTGEKPGKRPHIPYKVGMALLYGYVPGVKPMGNGVVFITIKDFTHHLRLQHNTLNSAIEFLHEWGVIKEYDRSRDSYVVKMNHPRIWKTND